MTKEELREKRNLAIENLNYAIAILGSDELYIDELEKENAELLCQKNRNKSCYSCANATEKCFRNEIGCPCQNYKSYKEENAELKKACDEIQELLDKQIEATYKLDKENAELKEEIKNNEDLATVAYMQGAESQKKKSEKQLAKAKRYIKDLLGSENTSCEEEMFFEIRQKAEQFLKEVSE